MSAVEIAEPDIALVLTAEAWVDALHRHCADHGGARVRSMVLDPLVALDEEFDVLVAGERWPALTRSFVDALHARGRRVLVVRDGRADDLACVGADGMVSAQSTPGEIVAAVAALVPRHGGHGSQGSRSSAQSPRPPLVPTGSGPASAADRGPAGARSLVVGGPIGAGSTEVAIGLAACSARHGAPTVLVDADQANPSVAARLGLPLEPNLCTAVDAVAFGLGAVPGALFDLGPGWPVVLAGAPNRRSAAALSGSDVRAVGAVLAERFEPIVFDVSCGDPDMRNALVADARAVVAVGTGDPVGAVRLAEWIAEIASATRASVHVVVNRAPASRARRTQLADELGGDHVAAVTFTPSDSRVEEAAWSASTVARGAFAHSVDGLYDAVGSPEWLRSPTTRRRAARVA